MENESGFLGNIYGHGQGYAGAVFDQNKICPTLNTMAGGGRQPMILEPMIVCNQGESFNKFIDSAITLRARDYKGLDNFRSNAVLEVNPSEDGTSSTIKANYLNTSTVNMERSSTFGASGALEIKVLGNYMASGHDASRIVDSEGLAPTVKENHGTVTAHIEASSTHTHTEFVRKTSNERRENTDRTGRSCRLELSNEQDTPRKSNRQREHFTNSDNGEYP